MKKIIPILSFIFLFISMFFLRHYLSIFFFQNDRYKVAVNIETKKSDNNDIFICFNKNCDKMKYENNIFSYKLNQENPLFYYDNSGEVEIISDNKNFINSIKNISVFSGNFYYLTEFKQEETTFQDKKAYSVKVLELNNDKSLFKKAGVYFESIFYNWYFYIISYILIVLYFYKYRFEIKIKNSILIVLILCLGLFLRLSHINFIPLWNDELYTLTYMSDGKMNFLKTFSDAGNPPLFFIISNIWLLFFNKSLVAIRLLPCLIGLFNIYSVYFVVNKILNKKTAVISAFLTSINIFIILESTEIRSYILSMTLILWGGYYFYRLYKEFSNKNLIKYSVISILLINLHFYTLLFSVFNFISGLFLFKKNKKFIISGIVSFLTVIPYIINVLKISLSETFNVWLEKPTVDVLYNHILFYFGNIVFFVLTLIFSAFIIKKYIDNDEKKVVLYNIFAIVFVFISAFLFSYLIKPVLFERYFCIFLPLLIINTAVFLNANYKTKHSPVIIALIFILSISMPKYENFNLFSNINEMMKYSAADSKNNENYYFVIPDRIDYIKYFKDVDIKRVIVTNYGTREDIDLMNEYKKNISEKNAILYIPEIAVNSRIKYSKETNIIKIDTTTVPVYKIKTY